MLTTLTTPVITQLYLGQTNLASPKLLVIAKFHFGRGLGVFLANYGCSSLRLYVKVALFLVSLDIEKQIVMVVNLTLYLSGRVAMGKTVGWMY